MTSARPCPLSRSAFAVANCCFRKFNCASPILEFAITPSVPPSLVFEYRPMNFTNGAFSVKYTPG